MTSPRFTLALIVALASAAPSGCAAHRRTVSTAVVSEPTAPRSTLEADLDRIFKAPVLDGAFLAVRVESLRDGRLIYERHATSRVVPASALKIVTAAVAGERLGWTHRFETRLEAAGTVVDSTLHGDLFVVGTGDPTINAQDLITAPLFNQWADVLAAEGIRRVDGRLIGDDTAFDDEALGAGWAWDYLTATYAAPSGALSYNENLVAIRITPGPVPGATARLTVAPPGHGLVVDNRITTAPTDDAAAVTLERWPGSATLTARGAVPAGSDDVVRATTVAHPTMFFVEALRLALAARGIRVDGGAHAIRDVATADRAAGPRRVLARHQSPPLSAIVAEMLKTSQNFYAEMLIKSIGQTDAASNGRGSTELGRRVVRETLAGWNIPTDALVQYDGSGLSRYNYASADLLVGVLRRMWAEERHRGPFAAALPVAGHDGTLGVRMTSSLRRRVQAKTGTIANVRSLAGYAETDLGEKVVFAMVANHFIAPNVAIDAVMEEALERILTVR